MIQYHKTYKFNIEPYIKYNILYEKNELCADVIVINNSNILKLVNAFKVYKEKTIKNRSPIIFHTHPRSSYSVPSIEDINEVFKNNIRTSIIVSSWGLFQIIKTKELNNNELNNNKNTKEKSKEKKIPDDLFYQIKSIIDNINIITTSNEYQKFKRKGRKDIKFKGNKNTDWEMLSTTTQNIVRSNLEYINMYLHEYSMYINFNPIKMESYPIYYY